MVARSHRLPRIGGNPDQFDRTSAARTSSSSRTAAPKSTAIRAISASPMPWVVTAAVPSRMPRASRRTAARRCPAPCPAAASRSGRCGRRRRAAPGRRRSDGCPCHRWSPSRPSACQRRPASTRALATTWWAYARERRRRRLPERDRLGGDRVHLRAALGEREDGPVDPLGELRAAQDHAAARPAQHLVRGGAHHIGVRDGTGRGSPGDQPDADARRRRSDTRRPRRRSHGRRRSRGAGGRRSSRRRSPWAGGCGPGSRTCVVVDQPALGVDPVADEVEPAAGEVGRRAVGEVSAVREAQARGRCRRGAAAPRRRRGRPRSRSAPGRWRVRHRRGPWRARRRCARRRRRFRSRRGGGRPGTPRRTCCASGEPRAARTAGEVKFSAAISCRVVALPVQLPRAVHRRSPGPAGAGLRSPGGRAVTSGRSEGAAGVVTDIWRAPGLGVGGALASGPR